MINQKRVAIELPLPIDAQSHRLTPEGLDILMGKLKSIVRDTPELKTVQSKAYKELKPFLVDGLVIAIKCTSILINRGVEDDGIESDTYNLLAGNFNQSGNRNPIMQAALREARTVYKKGGTDDFDIKADFEDGKGNVQLKYSDIHPDDVKGVDGIPMSPEDTSKVLDDIEGREDLTEDQKVADVTTNDGGRIRFDKVQLTVVFYKANGEVAARIPLAPKETWRRVIVDFFVAFFKGAWNFVRHPIKTSRKIGSNIKGWFKKDKPVVTGLVHSKAKVPVKEKDTKTVTTETDTKTVEENAVPAT